MDKNMKYRTKIKTLVFIIAAMLLLTAGCTQPAGTDIEPSDPSATATATPTPEPKGLEAVFGKKEITVAVTGASGDASILFIEGAQAEADALGVKLETSESGSPDAVIAFALDEKGYADASGAKAHCIFGMGKGNAQGISNIYYSPEGEVSLAFDAALTYPPHDTPVRLILMFESAESESYKEYQKLYDEGKIFPKEIYVASEEEQQAGEWLTGKLERYVEGMLDGVYAENSSLALSALSAIETLEREDMEVFCVGVTAETVSRMAENPEVFAQSAGANTYLAGVLSVRAALKALKGEEAVALELEPALISAAELKEGSSALLTMGGDQSGLFNEPWMDELREYYGSTAQ